MFTVLAERRIQTNSAYAKKTEDILQYYSLVGYYLDILIVVTRDIDCLNMWTLHWGLL